MSEFKPPAKGLLIHSVAFFVATILTSILVRLLNFGLTDVNPLFVAYFINPALTFFVWPWVISWFRLQNNSGLGIYFGVITLLSPYALWWYYTQQWGVDVVSLVLMKPTVTGVLVSLILSISIYWRLRKLDDATQFEVYTNSKRLRTLRKNIDAVETEELSSDGTIQESSSFQDAPNSVEACKPERPTLTGSSVKMPTEKLKVDDEVFYKAALDEVEEDDKVAETWAKALTLCRGDKEAAKWKYIELRVEWLCQNQQ